MKNGRLDLLIVEDEAAHVEAIRRAFDQAGTKADIHAAGTLREYRDIIAAHPPDFALVDLNLPDGRATEILTHPAAEAPFPILVMTAFGNQQIVVEVMKAGALDYVVKSPETFAAMPQTVARALREWQLLQKQKRAEADLKASEERYRGLVETTFDWVWEVDAQGRYTYASPRVLDLLGYRPEEMIGRTPFDLMPEDEARRVQAVFAQIAAQREPFALLENTNRHRDGRLVVLETNGTPILSPEGTLLGYRGMDRDITERKRAEADLKASEDRYRRLFDESLDGICLADAQTGMILDCNPALSKLVGREKHELVGQSQRILHPPGEAVGEVSRSFKQHRHEKSGQVLAVPVITKTGEVRTAEIIANMREVQGRQLMVGIFRDITEQKKLEAQLRRTQRLESIGTLAGGIAHDLNNALAPIMMSAELLRLEFPDTASRYLEIIQASTKRGADMVKQLLTFAKGIEGERLLLQPKHLLKEMEKLIQNTFLKEIELRTHYPKDLWTILGDATQLHQVLLNLCVNARDAMPGGGTLTLEGENQELDAVYASTVLEAKPGRYVVWRVKDTGTGIPPEVLERIFDPFFTTKGPDKGTGLGLSTTMGIVKSHGGFIQVYSTPGQGSTFAVYLPACGAGASDTVLLTKADTAFRGHGETILLVDDEESVRNMLRAILTNFNFRVLTAGDGADALLQVAEQQTELRVVITDLHMPNMDGLSFVRVIKGRLPGVGIIVVSGRMEEREENEFKQLGVHAVLQKPFTQAQLVEALKTVFQK
jgi:hypothetical protein